MNMNEIVVINLKENEVILKDQKAKSLAFNTDLDDILTYWNEGNVYIKTEDFPPNIEKMNGVIVGYKGTKIFSNTW